MNQTERHHELAEKFYQKLKDAYKDFLNVDLVDDSPYKDNVLRTLILTAVIKFNFIAIETITNNYEDGVKIMDIFQKALIERHKDYHEQH